MNSLGFTVFTPRVSEVGKIHPFCQLCWHHSFWSKHRQVKSEKNCLRSKKSSNLWVWSTLVYHAKNQKRKEVYHANISCLKYNFWHFSYVKVLTTFIGAAAKNCISFLLQCLPGYWGCTCEYPTIAGVLISIMIEAIGPPKSESILTRFMLNGPKRFQTSIGRLFLVLTFYSRRCFLGQAFSQSKRLFIMGILNISCKYIYICRC